MEMTKVNNSILTKFFKGNDSSYNKFKSLGDNINGVKNISLPLLFNNNAQYEEITFGTPKEIKTILLSTFAQKAPIKINQNILEAKEYDNHDDGNIVNHDDSNIDNHDDSNIDNHDGSNIDNHDGSNIDNHDGSNIDNHDDSNIDSHDGSNIDNHDGSNIDNHDDSNIDNHDGSNIDNHDGSNIDNHDEVDISRSYTEKRNQELQKKLNDYRNSNNNNINKTEDENIEKRYNLNSSDFSIIKNEIKNKELSKKEKVLIMKKYLQANDIFMKKVGFIEKIKNIFGKSEKIYWIKREQATDALNILNKFMENSENINKK
ncbi:hypothetical protein AALC12_05075 [Proteus faecis]|uniref:hypothetical protein n=1 Tax=Proteus faecis TaxID=2050967 RepID=UPI003511E1CE